MMKQYIIVILLFPVLLSAQQSKLNGSQFLIEQLTRFEQSLTHHHWINDSRFTLIDKIEFRTETHEFLPEEQEYVVRVSPDTWGEHKARKALLEKIHEKPDFRLEDHLCDLSHDIQEEWLSLWQMERLLVHYQEELLLNWRMDSLFSYDLSKNKLDDILKLRNERNDLNRRIQKIESKRDELCTFFGIDRTMLDFSDRISPDSLSSRLTRRTEYPKDRSVASIEYDQQLNQLEQQLEIAEGRQFIDFFQLRYRGPQTEPWEERISLSLGIILPNSGNRQLNLKELEIEEMELANEKNLELIENERERQRKLGLFEQQLDHYQYMVASVDEEKAKLAEFSQQLARDQLVDVALYYQIESRILKLKKEVLEAEYDLYRKILDFYKSTELLCSAIYNNWIFGE